MICTHPLVFIYNYYIINFIKSQSSSLRLALETQKSTPKDWAQLHLGAMENL